MKLYFDHDRTITKVRQQSRPRTASITRHLSGFGERLRQRQTDSSNHTEEAEESSRKSKLLLGGQKLLGKLRD